MIDDGGRRRLFSMLGTNKMDPNSSGRNRTIYCCFNKQHLVKSIPAYLAIWISYARARACFSCLMKVSNTRVRGDVVQMMRRLDSENIASTHHCDSASEKQPLERFILHIVQYQIAKRVRTLPLRYRLAYEMTNIESAETTTTRTTTGQQTTVRLISIPHKTATYS
jgi:hypothetical protein